MRIIILFLFFAGQTSAQVLNDSLQGFDSAKIKSSNPLIKTSAIAAGYVGICFLTYRYADENVKEFVFDNQNKTVYNSFKAVGNLGLGTSSIIITAGTGIISLITKNKKLQRATIELAGAHVLNDLVTNQFKITFQRHRPNTGDAYNTFDWRDGSKQNKSFISSHTSNAFTTATVFALCFPDKKWISIAGYSLAGVVGLSRIYQNEHWTSDVLAGAAIGYLSALATHKLYNIAGKKFTFLPEAGNKFYSVNISYRLP